MKPLFRMPRIAMLLLVLLGAVVLNGCASTDLETDNRSVRPWNSPQGWENGIPSAMTEGR